jgi:hypothetical protein
LPSLLQRGVEVAAQLTHSRPSALGLFLPLEELFEGLDEELNVEFDLIPPASPDEEYVESPASDIPE